MMSMTSCWLCAKVVNDISQNFFSLQSYVNDFRNVVHIARKSNDFRNVVHIARKNKNYRNVVHIVKKKQLFIYIYRCELWEFIREINSGIFTCENISFFLPELLLHNYKCSGYVPCCVIVNTHTIVN
jgi:hypothetical protein